MNTPEENSALPLRERLIGLSEPERAGVLLGLVRAEVAAATGGRPGAVEANAPWRRLGIYREFATELRERLCEATRLWLPATVLFDYPTPAALAGHLRAELLGEPAALQTPAPEGLSADDDPIAIVGMACRFPGDVRSPEELWQLVAEGRDAISAFPRGRGWDVEALYHPDTERRSATYSRGGGFLHDVDQFDAGFFGIGPREAKALDPQQRLLLDTSWEALEHAGIDPLSLTGSKTGVYVGIAYQDYGPRWHEPPQGYEGHLLMGSLTSAASGRISYTWGLEGPAMTVDTACSSSLVALHLAAQALRGRECSLALAGGATVMATPGVFLEFSRKRGLAPDGRCKSFSADADGTGWGEGAGMLVLERLSDARRSGHRVLALIRGSALNQDGASNGLTAPNGLAQQRVIRQALANAGLRPEEVDAVEAHGTGTALGDPIEAQALIATYGQSRPADRPLWLGSLKSNIGHSQAAAVVGGVIKMVLAMQHGALPRTLHVGEPSPHVDWSAGAVSLLTEQRPWPRNGRPRRAGVSAFGVSGTNGHVILEEAPCTGSGAAGSGPAEETVLPWVISGQDAGALRGQAGRLRAHLDAHPGLRPVDIGYSLAGRTRFRHRAVLVATGREGFRRALDALAREAAAPGLVTGTVEAAGKVAFLFTGQGSQRPGLGRELHRTFPAFAGAWNEVCTRLDTHLDRSLCSVTWAPAGSAEAELLNQTAYTQAALFTFEVSLFRLVEQWGLIPDLLLGHSIGELAAAHVAGVLTLDDACTLVAARGRLMQACRSDGAMVSIQAGEEEVRAGLETLFPGGQAGVGIAAVNGPRATVIAGDEAAVMRIRALWAARQGGTTRLAVSHAFHSPHMEAMLEEFRRVAESLSFQPPSVPIVSTLTGEIAPARQLCSPGYWVRHARETVRFLDGMRRLEAEGVTAFLELGPDATLTAMGRGCLTRRGGENAVLVPALRGGRPEVPSLITALAELHVRGGPVDWRALFSGWGARQVDLPTYAFQRRRHWLDAPGLTAGADLPATVAGWRYRVQWKPARVAAAPLAGTWLVLTGDSNAESELAAMLTTVLISHGVQTILVRLEDTELHRDQLSVRLDKALADNLTPDGVLSLLALDETPHSGQIAMTRGVLRSFALAQAWTRLEVQAPLWCATRSAVCVGGSDPLRSPAQAMVWGLGRSVGLEHPRSWGGMVDLPDILDEQSLRWACGALAGLVGEDQLAVRDSGVFVRRIVRAAAPPPREWRPRGTALITGGTGALGAHAARWLARHGTERLVLVSRRGLSAPGAVELRDELTALGAQVTVASCDVADRESLAGLVTSLAGGPALTVVVHAAGVSGRFAPLGEVSPAEFADVIAAKVAGAAHLDSLLQDHPLEAFVLISSIAGIWGSGAQGAYAAGNAFLDALARHRRGRGLVATSLAWGPWARDGMAADPAVSEHLLQRGLPAMAAPVAATVLGQAITAGDPELTVVDVDWQRFLPAFTAVRASRLFEDLPEAGTAGDRTGTSTDQVPPPWTRRLVGTSGPERDRILLELVRVETADILGHATPEDVDVTCSFLELGFDSLAAVELRKRLTRILGLTLPTTVVFDHPTATVLAGHLATELAADPACGSEAAHPAPTSTAHAAPHDAEPETVRFLYRRACRLDMLDTGLDVLRTVAKLRPVFHRATEIGRYRNLVRLAEGPITPALVCVPPFVAPSGAHNYARLALNLHGLRDVYALSHPGFGDREPLPATLELVVAMHAQAVCRQLGELPFAVVGYSSGGWFAHALAAHLETLGVFPAAVVLLDSLAIRDDAWDHIRSPLKTMALNDQAFALMTDDQLTATATYFHFFNDWKPTPISAPVLLVRPTECVPEWMGRPISEGYWRAAWDFTHETLEVSGNHYSIMKERAASTALALHRWLENQPGQCPAVDHAETRLTGAPLLAPPAAGAGPDRHHRGHIAMFGIPAHGHVNPSLAIIGELVDRGYRVTYSINEEFAPLVEAAGATPVLYRSTMPSQADPGSSYPQDYIATASMALDEAMAVLPQLAAAYETDRPDLLLYDIGGYAAPVLGARWAIPVIQLSPTYVAWEGYEQDMAPLIEAMEANPAGVAYRTRFTSWLRDQGIDRSYAEFVGRPQRCIVLIPRILQPNEEKVAQTYTFVGPCLDDRSRPGSWQPPDDGRPVLLISLGSAYTDRAQFYRECIAAFEDLDWHVVMAIGRHVDPGELGPVPGHIEVHRWVPQLSVLSRAAAFITHAGMGSTLEGLHHGVPLVAVPQAMDQYVNAERIATLGVGRHLPREQATAAALREAVLAVAADPGIADRLRRIREEMRSAGGAAAAADLIEQHRRALS